MMFSIDMLNTKVVDNFLIFLVLKFYDFRYDGLGVIDFRHLLSGFCMSSGQIGMIVLFGLFNMESCIGDNSRVVVLFLIFLKCLRSLLLVVYNSSCCCSKWNGRFYPNLDRDAFLMLFNLVSYRIILR